MRSPIPKAARRSRLLIAITAVATAVVSSLIAAGTASPAMAAAGTAYLYANQQLNGGQELVNGLMTFVLGSDGNLVLTDDGHAVWANGETGHPGATLDMQGDGNLVEYYNGSAIWNTGTAGHAGAYLELFSTAMPAVLGPQGGFLWQTPMPNTYFSSTVQDAIFPSQALPPGQTMYDVTAKYSLYVYQGWLEEYVNGTNNLVWYAGSYCSGSYQVVMQTDGNLVIYCNGVATWSSGTGGHPASYGIYMHLQDDGNIVLYSNYGRVYWANGK